MPGPWNIITTVKVRYPPFESSLKAPEHLPLAEREIVMMDSVEDLDEAAKKLPAPLVLGKENGWFIKREYFIENNEGERSRWEIDGGMDERPFPAIVERQRRGWYLTPHPVHRIARRIITLAVAILLISLTYQAFEPILLWAGILSSPLAGSVQLGLLDYPTLMVVVVPFMILPIILRIGANLRDLNHQRRFLSTPPPSPVLEFTHTPVSTDSLKVNLRLTKVPGDWKSLRVWWQVGILPPAREELVAALGGQQGGQPPPGLTTPSPHYWEEGLSDGTGVGEDTPMEHHDSPGGMFLRPMRILRVGGRARLSLEGGEFSLHPPKGNWPGTQAGDLIRVHWELVVRINRESKGPLYWVEPLRVKHGKGPFEMRDIPVNDGRIEDLIY